MDTHPTYETETYWFGRRLPADTPFQAAWGARAILNGRGRANQAIDLVPDRKQFWTNDGQPVPPPFIAFLRDKVAPWIDAKCGARWIDPGGSELYVLEDGIFRAEACAQNSYGYLYVAAWMLAPETAP
jgi:hypothetical protein